ncbi:MAG: outer membrane lipoprotein-sorting protein [candidate division Zixibacteria bacterium]|nr:outer membrane lipoprotein-sorting protein [candidate division Zixibacteria bacterium]MDH3936374.1 outer membrane lipoprotein-sorting protein [candidate division Zixibacteria bacterium]MDH4032205.1 outer membrane lipoprotein-sorting protein [candidate division Zixibacteria bacterium]
MKTITIVTSLLLNSLLVSTPVFAQSADDIMQKSHLAYYYAADDGVAEVTMRIVSKRGKERIKQFVMLRLDEEDGGNQRYYTYFRKPSDVSRLTFMVHKSPHGNDQRWIYVPSVDLVKPISADDKNSSFVGSHFSYEDVSGRHYGEDKHTLLSDSTLNERAVYVVRSVPKESYKGFAQKMTYVDKANFLPLKEEYFDKKGNMVRLFTAERVEVIDGITTMTARSMENLKKGGKTLIEFSSIRYNVGLEASLFTERYLKNPPRDYIK